MRKDRLMNLCLFFPVVLLLGLTTLSFAAYPDRPITLICAWTPGGGVDLSARTLAKSAERLLGQPIAVVNKPGASGSVGMSAVAIAKPDGYTIGTCSFTSLSILPHTQDVSYDPFKDLEYIMGYGKFLFGTFVRSDSPFKTLKDLVTFAKANPGKIKYGTVGIGSANNFGMVNLAKAEGITWTPVIFKGGPEVVTAVLGGHIEVGSTTTTELAPYLQSGKMRLLVSMDTSRWPWAPDVPTIKELGYTFYVLAITGIAAPKETPQPIVEKLQEVFKKTMEDPEFKQVMERIYFKPEFFTGIEYRKLLEEDFNQNQKIMMDLGIHKSHKK